MSATSPHARGCRKVAVSSAPRNIAEGFGRYDHKEFAQFLKIAIGSIQETRYMILEAYDHGFITEQERDEGNALGRTVALQHGSTLAP